MFEEENILLSQEHPPTEKTVKIIEKYLSGIIYDDQHIYLNSEHTIEEIASTMVHESCHFLNLLSAVIFNPSGHTFRRVN